MNLSVAIHLLRGIQYENSCSLENVKGRSDIPNENFSAFACFFIESFVK